MHRSSIGNASDPQASRANSNKWAKKSRAAIDLRPSQGPNINFDASIAEPTASTDEAVVDEVEEAVEVLNLWKVRAMGRRVI